MSPDGVLALYRSQSRPLTAYFVRRTGDPEAAAVAGGDKAGWTGYAPLRTG